MCKDTEHWITMNNPGITWYHDHDVSLSMNTLILIHALDGTCMLKMRMQVINRQLLSNRQL